MPAAGPRCDLTCSLVPRKSPMGVPVRLRMGVKRVGSGCQCGALTITHTQHCADVWSHSRESFPLLLFCPSCRKLWGPPVQNLHPAPVQMCLTASLGHRQHCLSWRYRGLVDLQWLIDSSVEGWQSKPRMAGNKCSHLVVGMNSFVNEYNLTCPICVFVSSALIPFTPSPLYFNIAIDLRTAAWPPITMSSCVVIYSPINIPPLVWLWDQGGYSSCSSSRTSTLASIEHAENVQRKHHTVLQRRARLLPPNWKL